ncbi:hypothetical protein EVAR_15967_1 [Eumeta japonica]|uniref:Uncharacterized protein n=1 Tax=Eumeta variegata TaxID=151549 RepID=A0A4C1UMU0_EUMVA|nr:hypothetical protein EVAR_15967_1 [Eumeta japonica]
MLGRFREVAHRQRNDVRMRRRRDGKADAAYEACHYFVDDVAEPWREPGIMSLSYPCQRSARHRAERQVAPAGLFCKLDTIPSVSSPRERAMTTPLSRADVILSSYRFVTPKRSPPRTAIVCRFRSTQPGVLAKRQSETTAEQTRNQKAQPFRVPRTAGQRPASIERVRSKHSLRASGSTLNCPCVRPAREGLLNYEGLGFDKTARGCTSTA